MWRREQRPLYDIPTISCKSDQDSRWTSCSLDRSIATFFADWPSKKSGLFGVQLSSGILAFQYGRPGVGVDPEGLLARAVAGTWVGMSICESVGVLHARCDS
jgi:hypothetical protein